MAFNDLREFIEVLKKSGELAVIKTPVSTDLEIAEITDRVSKSKGAKNKALLFTNVKGYDVPVLINAFGSMSRVCKSLEVDNLDEIAERIRVLIKPKVPESFLDKVAMLPTLMEVGKFPPKVSNSPAPCQEVVLTDPKQPMLDKLPIIKCWPEDAGDFVTLGVVITRDPKNGIRNLGVYRLQRYDNTTTGMHWHKHHDGAKHFEERRREGSAARQSTGNASGQPGNAMRQTFGNTSIKTQRTSIDEPPNYGTIFSAAGPNTAGDAASESINVPLGQTLDSKQTGKRLEVAVVIGADPSVTYAATAPLPPDIDELLFAGFLRQSPVKLVKCKTIDLEVPATAEIVLEGYVEQSELREEGPFGDHTGFYSLAGMFPVFHVTAVTHRKNPIYQTTIVGKPPQEDCYLGKATERIFLPMVQMLVSEIVDMNLPWEGVFHNCAIISIDKRFPGHAKKVMSAVWGLGQLMFTKFVIIVDKDINVHDLSEVALNVFGNVDPKRDTMQAEGPLDILDHSAPIMGYGSKIGIDATRKWRSEGFDRVWPEPIVMADEIKALVSAKWAEYGL